MARRRNRPRLTRLCVRVRIIGASRGAGIRAAMPPITRLIPLPMALYDPQKCGRGSLNLFNRNMVFSCGLFWNPIRP